MSFTHWRELAYLAWPHSFSFWLLRKAIGRTCCLMLREGNARTADVRAEREIARDSMVDVFAFGDVSTK